jgi:hypothetical protein
MRGLMTATRLPITEAVWIADVRCLQHVEMACGGPS